MKNTDLRIGILSNINISKVENNEIPIDDEPIAQYGYRRRESQLIDGASLRVPQPTVESKKRRKVEDVVTPFVISLHLKQDYSPTIIKDATRILRLSTFEENQTTEHTK